MLTSFLEALALVLFVVAAALSLGVAAALFVAGACCLGASWAITRPKRVRK